MTTLLQSIGPTQRTGRGIFFDWPHDMVPDGGMSDGQNVEPRGFHAESATVAKAPGWTKYSSTAIPGTGPVMLLREFIKAAGTRSVLACSTTRLSKYNVGTGVFDDVTGGTNLLTAIPTVPIFAATLNDLFIVGDKSDAPRKYDGTTWALLAGSPPTCGGWDVYESHLLGWNTPTVEYRTQWSDLNAPETWASGEAGILDIRDENLLGILAGGKMRRQYLLYKEQLGGVYALTYVGLPLIMTSELVIPQFGVFSPRGVAVHGDAHFVLGSDEKLWAISPGSGPQEIAQGLRKRLYGKLNWDKRRAAFVVVNSPRDVVAFCIPEGSSTVASRAYLYNFRTGGTGEMEFPFESAMLMRDATATTINSLAGTINALVGNIDDLSGLSADVYFLGGNGTTGYVHKQSGESQDGVAMDSWVVGKWLGSGDGRAARARGIEADVVGSVTGELGTADTIGGTMSYTSVGTLGTTNRADANLSARYLAPRFRSQSLSGSWELSGYRMDVRPGGRR